MYIFSGGPRRFRTLPTTGRPGLLLTAGAAFDVQTTTYPVPPLGREPGPYPGVDPQVRVSPNLVASLELLGCNVQAGVLRRR